MQQSGADGVSKRAVTRADVARYAGVSDAVVSFVLNGGPKSISEPTAARVRDAVEKLGYRPNRTARALAMGTTKTIGLVVPDSTNPFYAEFALAIQRAAGQQGFALMTVSWDLDATAELRGMLDLSDRQVDGLLMARGTGAGSASELARRGVHVPVVVIDSASPYPGFTALGPAAADGIEAVVDHLIQRHGHTSVALIVGDTANALTDGRETGWLRSHAKNRCAPGRLQPAPFTRLGGYQAALTLLTDAHRPSAVVTGSDIQAVGVLRAARELGMSVPGDLAVASFDGTEEALYTAPSLTTSRQPVQVMAEAAVAAVLAARPHPGHEVFATSLIVGESCGCPPSTSSQPGAR